MQVQKYGEDSMITITDRATERGVQAVHCTGAHDQKEGPMLALIEVL